MIAAAALEHAEDVRRAATFSHAAAGRAVGRMPCFCHVRVGRRRAFEDRGLAVARVGLAEDVVLERQDAVVVRGAAPEHRRRRHQAALGRLDDRQVAGAAGLARDALVARVDEAHELRALAVQQRVGALGIRARRDSSSSPGSAAARARLSRAAAYGLRLLASPPPAHATFASPPWQSVQPSITAGLACMRRLVGRRVAGAGSRRSSPRPLPPSAAPAPAAR